MKKTVSFILALVLCAALLIVPASAANEVNVVSNITIEIPESNGTQFTLTNVHDKFAGTYSSMDYDLLFFYSPNAQLTCNKDLYLYEIQADNVDVKFYHYNTFTVDNRASSLQETYVAGTPINLDSIQTELSSSTPHYEPGKATFVVEREGLNYGRQIYFYPSENFNKFTDSESLDFYAITDLSTTPNPLAGAADWAKPELEKAIAENLVSDDIIAKGGWAQPTSRLDAAVAMVTLIEKVTGKTIDTIASEKGWDLMKNGFDDTSAKSVTFLKYAGITNGVGDNKYDPSGTYTRAHEVTMIGRVAENILDKSAKGDNPFTDVPDWAAPYVGYAAENGITNGIGGGLFDSDGVLQNQHTAIFNYRAYIAWK